MFIIVEYKQPPELSILQNSRTSLDSGIEKNMLVNPKCYVRSILDHIRKECKLAPTTQFDLAESNGALKGLFDLPADTYADNCLEHRRTYYLIVLLTDNKQTLVLPQVSHENIMYTKLQAGVKSFLNGSLRSTSTASRSIISTRTRSRKMLYKDEPELSLFSRRSMSSSLSSLDSAVEKTLLVNPVCHVRVMLEYIRKKCKLGEFTNFDLCDDRGIPFGLFDMPTYAYVNNIFEHKKSYYLIVLVMDPLAVLPQLNRENPMYTILQTKIKKFFMNENGSFQTGSSSYSKTDDKKNVDTKTSRVKGKK